MRDALLSFAIVAALAAPAMAEQPVDLELVLAVDASGSVDDREFRLQLEGIAQAVQDPAVIAAIETGPLKRIAIELLVWADHPLPSDVSGWFVITDGPSAAAFAAVVAPYPRRLNGGTGMGMGVANAARAMEDNGYAGTRLTIDVSGDGAESPPRDYTVLMPQARMMAGALGITINGLAILGSEDGVEEWYRNNVLTGPGSFLEVAQGYEDFARAMQRKLVQEIEVRPRLSMISPAANFSVAASPQTPAPFHATPPSAGGT